MHEGAGDWTSPLGIEEDFVRKFFDEWRAVAEQIASYNDLKKAMLSKTRALYGPYHTKALKRARNLALKDETEIVKKALLDKAADNYLRIIRLYP